MLIVGCFPLDLSSLVLLPRGNLGIIRREAKPRLGISSRRDSELLLLSHLSILAPKVHFGFQINSSRWVGSYNLSSNLFCQIRIIIITGLMIGFDSQYEWYHCEDTSFVKTNDNSDSDKIHFCKWLDWSSACLIEKHNRNQTSKGERCQMTEEEINENHFLALDDCTPYSQLFATWCEIRN